MFLLRVIAVIITSLVILALTWWGWTSSSSVAWISTSSTATSSAPHNLNAKYTETRLPPVALLDVLAEGDIIKNEFILHQRLDFLGVKSSHVSEDSSFLLAGSTTSPSIELAQTTSSPMKDISLFKQAFRVDDENIESVKNDFHLNEKVFFGGHGEIWLAHKIFAGEVDLNQTYILKRMNLRNRPDILRCALREIYFGELLQHDPRTTHLVAHFLHDNDYWLAFEDEGVSLQQLLYAVSFTATATLLEPSAIWKNLRSSKEGDDSFKSILYQIIKGVENLHSKGILHRDIKPSNLLINAKNKSGDFGGIRLLISDYSSAVSELALRSGLYGVLDENGDDHAQDYPPSVDEESPQYMPPEVTFSCFDFSTKSHSSNRGDNKFNSGVGTHSSSFISPPDNDQQREEEIGEENGSPHNEKCEPIAYDAYRPESYDIWSIGVVFAEMILGTADVFSVDPRTAALIKHRLRNSDLDTLDQTLTLAALADFCIYVPPNSQTSHDTSEANDPSTKRRISRHRYLSSNTACNVHHLAKAIQRRDPLGTGYHSYGIDLLHRMLKWEPSERITLQEALTHAYFVGPYVSPVDGTEHMTAADLQKYDSTPLPSAADVIEKKSLVIKQETSRSTQLLKEREVVSSIGSEVAVTSLVATSNPPFQLTKISADICPAATPEDSISAQRYCELKGVRELIDEAYGSSDNIFDKTILPNFPGRFRHAMNVSWRGNFTNISSPTMQMKPDDATIDVSDDYDTVFKQETEIMFQCQKCQRVFPMWESCHRHVNARNHGTKCDSVSPSTSNISFTLSGESGRKNRNFVPAILPSCLSSHALLDVGYDPSSGWCDLQGRRAYLEDTHAIRFEKEYKFFGVFDGHMGNRASKFVARHLQSLFHILASDATRDQKDFSGGVQHIKFQSIAASKLWLSAFGIDDANDDNTGKLNVQENLFENASLSSDIWKLTTVVNALHMSFVETNRFFERNHGLYPNDLHTGTTATVVLLFPTAIVVGHVGDSRAVICCDRHTDTGRLIALQLTVDHTPYNAVERSRIEALGGKVVNTGEKLRVNGAMAVTRSIGDFPFGSLLTPEPDIVVFHRYDTKRQPKNQSNSLNGDGSGQLDPCEMLYTMRTRRDGSISGDMHAVTQQFMVLASDGLFDVMSNDEVVRFVCASIVDIMKDSPTSKVEVDTVMIDESDTGAHEYVLPFNAFHIAAEQLAQEAYLRGSSDNIGVCIINLFEEF